MLWTVVAATTLLASAAGSPIGVGTEDTFFVQASADIDSDCTPSTCYYSATASAKGCSLTGGSVIVTTDLIGSFSFGVPVAGCNSDSDGDAGQFGSNCLNVTATLVPTVGPMISDPDQDCATPIDCLNNPVQRIACVN